MAAVRGAPPRWKVETVEELKRLLSSHPVIAVVSFRGVPASQMQKIRREFREFAKIRVVKNSLLERAIDALGGKYLQLKDYIFDQTAIVLTNMNPFKLYKKIEDTKVPSALKPNQVSPVDVTIEAGPTPIPPGPQMADLQAAGIPVAIEKGKVVVKQTVTLVKAGEVVRPEVARALEKLGVKPIKIGLETRAIYDSGIILTPDVLAIDTDKVIADIQEAYTKALNLAVNATYVTPETAEILIIKAVMEARNLAINAAIPEPEVMPDLLAKAHAQMLALASQLPEEVLDEELKSLLAVTRAVEERREEREEKREEEEEKEEREEEEAKEEEALEGLGALFG
ncbi:MAG: 50S ribosomal protein L10 [Archaeoglobaceae archaeon]